MNNPVKFEKCDGFGLLTIDSPPVNAISAAVTAGLQQAIDAFESDRSLLALVIHCAGKTFVAGGDINAFDDVNFSAAPYNKTLARIESLDRPVVAALHGHVLGGGLELAMACHTRVAMPRTRLGLPEIKLGILPGSLATQRLPRLVPVNVALDMMLSGKSIPVEQALALELVDAIEDGRSSSEVGLGYAKNLCAKGGRGRVTKDLPVRSGSLAADFFEKMLADIARKQKAYPAARAIVESVQACVTGSFESGELVEARLFEECRKSSQSKALRHLFFAEREAARIPGLDSRQPLRVVRKVGIIGAGTMGGGIAMNFANVGISTLLLEAQEAALERGLATVRKNYQNTVDKGRLSQETMDQRMQCLQGTLKYEDLADCDLVIEAVFEDMALKKQIMKKLGEVCKPGAILASNTSTLDVDIIADASGRPEDVVGTHFFSPANVMRLLEVVRGKKTSPQVLLTVMDIARRIGKTAVVSGVCYGFIGNRMAEPYMRENEFLLMEGASPAQIDSAVEDISRVGMAMGPCRMLDMAGIDVGAKTLIELGKSGGLPADPSYRAVCQTLHAEGRAGQKTGSGYYRYEGRTPVAEPATEATCVSLAKKYGIERRENITPEEIVERLMLPLINEAAKILEEGIALRPGDVDTVWVAGYGFPDHHGGPLWMADNWGIAKVVERLEFYAAKTGNKFGYWTPAKLLKNLAAKNARISDWSMHA
jgi:3-hydroxyacyl-CoA dehydrogenase